MVTWRCSGPFPGSYITPTRKPVIVLFAQAGISNVAEWVEVEIIQYTVCLTNQLYTIQATTGPIPCPGPLSVPLPSLCAPSQPCHCFDWDLCHLWLVNHVDTRVIHAWKGCLCLDPNTHTFTLFNSGSGLLCRQQLSILCDSWWWCAAKVKCCLKNWKMF